MELSYLKIEYFQVQKSIKVIYGFKQHSQEKEIKVLIIFKIIFKHRKALKGIIVNRS